MRDDMLRQTVATAIRTVLQEGLNKADDPVNYLRTAADEVRRVVTLFEQEGRAGADGSAIRSMLAEEVEAAARDLIRRLHH
jgi:hypothetical protein